MYGCQPVLPVDVQYGTIPTKNTQAVKKVAAKTWKKAVMKKMGAAKACAWSH